MQICYARLCLGLFLAACATLSLNSSKIRNAGIRGGTDSTDRNLEGSSSSSKPSAFDRFALEDLPDDIKLCRLPIPDTGEPRFSPQLSRAHKKINHQYIYQGAGHDYTDFMEQHLFPLILLKREQKGSSSRWGQRRKLLPWPNRNKSLLFVGNSHTRQMVGSLLCQYQDEVISSRALQPDFIKITTPTGAFVKVHAMEYKLKGNIKLNVIINHGAVYSQRWQANLEELTGRPLQSFDAIVLGHMNPYEAEYKDTSLWAGINRYGELFPEFEVDLEGHPSGFDIKDLAPVYSKPIVWVPPLSDRPSELAHHAATIEHISSHLQSRDNVRAVDSRENSDGAECSCLLSPKVTTCLTNTKNRGYTEGHRCMGKWGGQPDLVAWDVVENFHELLGGNATAAANASATASSSRT